MKTSARASRRTVLRASSRISKGTDKVTNPSLQMDLAGATFQGCSGHHRDPQGSLVSLGAEVKARQTKAWCPD